MGIQEIQDMHIISDEYGNYYQVMGTSHELDKLVSVKLSHIYFEKSFQRLFNLEDENKKFENKHIGVFLQDLVNGHIEVHKKKHDKIYSIRDLLDYGIEVETLNITVPHPRSRPINLISK